MTIRTPVPPPSMHGGESVKPRKHCCLLVLVSAAWLNHDYILPWVLFPPTGWLIERKRRDQVAS